jgi:hypothetical protein
MSELAEPCLDVSETIAALRLLGADKFDPVRLHYLQALATRVNAQEGPVKRILDGKLTQALRVFKERFAQAEGEARAAIDQIGPQDAQAIADVQRLFKAGDFKGVKQSIASLKPDAPRPSLGDLTRYMAQQAPEPAEECRAAQRASAGAALAGDDARHFAGLSEPLYLVCGHLALP